MAGTIQKAVANGDGKKTLQAYIKSMEGEIKKALPSVLTPERFTRMVLTALSSTPKLAQCTPQSFLGAMMQAAQIGMECNTPLEQAFLVPFNNKGTMECQFQIGYKGFIDLAYRSGDVDVIQAHVVHANDEFNYEYGLDPKLTHKPALHDRGEAVAVYAVFKTKSGGFGFGVMSMEDIRSFAEQYAPAYGSNYSPWKTSFEEMAKKTVLKRVLKYAPLKSEFVRAIAADQTIKTEISSDMLDVAGEQPIEAEYVEVDNETGEVKEDSNEAN